ncbi:hypothetical protein BDB01DRAFT_771761 [Pilobolus umbonatus]|nr:hypothetical protein BDB01DRAFT_771761 [Pilobolus umbonatus]
MENTPSKKEETSVTSNNETVDNDSCPVYPMEDVTSHSPTHSSSAFQRFHELHEAVLAAVNSHNMTVTGLSPNYLADEPKQEKPLLLLSEMDYKKKENIRASNRERKKKWRIQNEERNKDNDLRCRVNKRANKIFGNEDSLHKQEWIKEEFEKRRQKRLEKERRKHIVNNVLSVPSTANTPTHSSIPNVVSPTQLPPFYTPLPQIDTAAAAKLLNFPGDLQRQLLEHLNNSMLALTNGIQPTDPPTEVDKPLMDILPDTLDASDNNKKDDNTETKDEQFSVDKNSPSSSIDNTTISVNTNEIIPMLMPITTTEDAPTEDDHSNNSHSNGNSDDLYEECSQDNTSEVKEDKKPEYPMDAVLTLMQLNAGWRQ